MMKHIVKEVRAKGLLFIKRFVQIFPCLSGVLSNYKQSGLQTGRPIIINVFAFVEETFFRVFKLEL